MKKVSNIIIGFIAFFFVISFSVVITLNFKQLYYWDVENLNIPEYSGYSKEIIIENYDALIDYNSVFNQKPLEFNGFKMSEEGRIHFEEVKDIFDVFQVLMIIAGVLTICFFVFKMRKKDLEFLKFGAIFTVTIPTALGILIGLNWQWFFITFHEIAFDNDYWIFDPTKDEIINVLPDEFFMHCALMIVGVAIIFAVLMFLGYKKFKNR